MTHASSNAAPCALVVDDDGMVRMAAIDILEDAGFATFAAASGDTALLVLEEHHACIVLLFTDVQMPGVHDGFALARKVASAYPHVSIVVASGQAKPGPNDLPDGARFIGKPFSVDIVNHHLREVLPDEQKPEPLRDKNRA
ncbi:response regulator [Methylobacterium sp. 092160098-2]|uniref:response regulator n=1 Tax=Methylobacterium sp. 092160098-2 TaxID=3025129 RepID=UPI0023819DEB|nr:response regulator [Methylobacterium sp. 092160098-2]MDE4909232.1 response regulator [Methylobacterium sp. 092160098-2]